MLMNNTKNGEKSYRKRAIILALNGEVTAVRLRRLTTLSTI